MSDKTQEHNDLERQEAEFEKWNLERQALHEDLIKRVEAIDPEAAAWLRAPTIANFSNAPKLDSCFIFEDSPQGSDYWGYITGQLGDEFYAALYPDRRPPMNK